MRNISSNGLTKLTTKLGTEPIIIVEVDWARNSVASSYADKAVGTIPGKILQVSSLDNIVNVQNSGNSQSIDLTLDDTDGTLKGIIDTQDIHEVNVKVYQYFSGLDVADKFLVFAGRINSPIRWSEADRTLSFSVVSQIEDREFGFSAESGEIVGLPADMIGKPWPVVFGTCLDVPALRITKAITGVTLTAAGIITGRAQHLAAPLGNIDCGFGASVVSNQAAISTKRIAAEMWTGVDSIIASTLIDQANSMEVQVNTQLAVRQSQLNCGRNTREATVNTAEAIGLGVNPIRIIGGEDFPQGQVLTLNINGGLFTGTMSGQDFTVTSRSHPESDARLAANLARVNDQACSQATPSNYFEAVEVVPPGKGDFYESSQIRRRGFVVCTTPSVQQPSVTNLLESFQAPAGSRVTIVDGQTFAYVASITPGTVLDVKAYKTVNSVATLVSVPTSYYSVVTQSFGAFTATLILFNGSLSARDGEGWGDEIFVTFAGSIGPNTVDIIEWIVDNYTDLTVDAASFAAVRTLVNPFPSNFAVLTRKNTLGLLKDIAFQARCALWVNNGVVHVKYLPVEPDSDLTISLSDIELGSIETSTVDTEDLITKLVAEYKISLAEDEPNKIIIRNNVGKYGTKEETFDWFIYNGADIVYHAATFWGIRLSTSWKKISFRGFLPLLRLETFDTVLIDLPGYVANSSVKAVVEQATYDSDSNTVSITCLVPVVSGAMVKHPLFWPASSTASYPTEFDEPGNSQVSGTLPVGDVTHLNLLPGLFVGGINAISNGQTDRGKVNLNDSNFAAGEVVIGSTYIGASPGASPVVNTTLNFVAPASPIVVQIKDVSPVMLDIRTTKVFDRDNPLNQATLDSIIRGITSGDLVLDTTAKIGDGTNEATFDFKFDGDSGKFGAGTAFLKD